MNILLILLFFMISILFVKSFKTTSIYNNRNYLYLKSLKYTLPVINTFPQDENVMSYEEISIKDELESYLGINIKNPLSVVKKEIACSISNDLVPYSNEKEGFCINPFVLNKEDLQIYEENSQVEVDDSLVKPLDPSNVQVFIYHTHTSECYVKEVPKDISEIKFYNSPDKSIGVCSVGDRLKKDLEEDYGISVIHDTTVHDATAYAESYTRSSETVKRYLDEYKDFDLIIDIHRDSDSNRDSMVITLDGKSVAKFMFVLDRSNPHFSENQKVVCQLQEISDKLCKGLCKGVYYYDNGRNHFNQSLSNNSILIEVGSYVNTVEEADNTSDYLSRIIAEYLKENDS